MRLDTLHLYPVKSCRRVDTSRAEVQPWGLAGDRRWLVTDDTGTMLTQRKEPRFTRITPSLHGDGLLLAAPNRPDLHIPTVPAHTDPAVPDDSATRDDPAILDSPVTLGDPVVPGGFTRTEEIKVWRDRVRLSPVGAYADDWLSVTLGRPVRLFHLDDPTRRRVNPNYGRPDDRVSLADGYPLLLTNVASLAALNKWLTADSAESALPMTRFRPNVVVGGAPAWAEDDWIGRRVRIGSVVFRVPKPCARCVITTTDQETGVRGTEPLRTLAQYRNTHQKLLFGVNLIPDGTGDIAVDDPITLV